MSDFVTILLFVLVYAPSFLFWILLAAAIRIHFKEKKDEKMHEDDGK